MLGCWNGGAPAEVVQIILSESGGYDVEPLKVSSIKASAPGKGDRDFVSGVTRGSQTPDLCALGVLSPASAGRAVEKEEPERREGRKGLA